MRKLTQRSDMTCSRSYAIDSGAKKGKILTFNEHILTVRQTLYNVL